MSDQRSVHWTEDEELLARFVLGRLPGAESKRLEEHLVACDLCRNAVDNERRVAAAAKSLGRSEMKKRLADRVSGKRRRISIEAYSAAALVLLAVGIAWMSGVFSGSSEVKPVAETQSIGTEERKTNETDSDFYRRAEKGKAVRRSKTDSKDERGSGSTTAPLPERTLADAGAGKEEPVVADAVEEERTEIAAAPAAQPAPVNSMWIEGLELGIAESDRMNEALDAFKGGEMKMKRDVAVQTQRQTIDVQQRSTSELPPLQQQWQQQRRSVQAYAERRDGQLRLTVYTEHPITASDSPPEVRQIREDSLVVVVGQQRIGFRLPQALTR